MKFFHELTREEFSQMVGSGMTWDECAAKHPQPPWCQYPNAVQGEMGCWSLMDFRVIGVESYADCDLFDPPLLILGKSE